jgi:hypothetical protein
MIETTILKSLLLAANDLSRLDWYGASQRVGCDAFFPGFPKRLPRRRTRLQSDIAMVEPWP